MTVWNRQDWAWRAGAITGLVAGLVGALCSGAMGMSGLIAVIVAIPVICYWVILLRWAEVGLLWGASWAGATVVLLVCAATGADETLLGVALGAPGALDLLARGTAQLWLALPAAAVVSSQVWIVWEASRAGHRRPHLRDMEAGTEIGAKAKGGGMWRIAWWLGGATAIASVIVAASYHAADAGSGALRTLDFVASWGYVALLTLVGLVILLVWRSLMVSSRGWLFWLLMWTLPLAGYSAIVAGGARDPETPRKLVLGAAYLLVAATQVWVALKAREVQREQAASEVRRLD